MKHIEKRFYRSRRITIFVALESPFRKLEAWPFFLPQTLHHSRFVDNLDAPIRQV